MNRRARLNGVAFDHLPWLPPALAARLRADTATELQAPVYYARLKAAPAATPNPQAPTNTPCNLQPPVHNPVLRRDARGRFAARPKPALRGRKAELEAARLERERLAPWRAGIKQARLSKRLLMHQAQTARRANRAHSTQPSRPPGASPEAGTGLPAGRATGSHSVAAPCHGGTLAPVARRENPDQDAMHPRTVAGRENPDQDAMHPRAMARRENPDQDSMQPRTVAGRENPDEDAMHPRAMARRENPDQDSMQPRTVAGRENPDQDAMHPRTVAQRENPDQDPMQPRTVARRENPDQDAMHPRAVPPFENPDQHPMHPRTVPHPAGPASAAGEASNQHAMQRGAGGEPAAATTTPASREPADPRNPGPSPVAQPHQRDHDQDRSHPMQPRTVAGRENPDQDPRRPRTVPWFENPDQHPMQPRTVPHPAGPASAAGEASNQHAMQRGAGGEARRGDDRTSRPRSARHNPGPPPATQPHQRDHDQDRSHPMHPRTVQPGNGPFHRALLSGTASNTPVADKLAAHVRRGGGWPVMAAAVTAKHAGLDWRPAATAARQHIADDAKRQRSRLGPLCGPSLRLAPDADLAHAVRLPGDP